DAGFGLGVDATRDLDALARFAGRGQHDDVVADGGGGRGGVGEEVLLQARERRRARLVPRQGRGPGVERGLEVRDRAVGRGGRRREQVGRTRERGAQELALGERAHRDVEEQRGEAEQRGLRAGRAPRHGRGGRVSRLRREREEGRAVAEARRRELLL